MSHRVLIADDHVAIRQGVARVLGEACPCGFEFASSHAEVLSQLDRGHWDLIILDLNMPGGNPFEFVESLKARRPSLKILVYTIEPADQVGIRALKAGADGFLGKGEPADTLVTAARRVLEGKRYLGEALVDHLAGAVARPDSGPAYESLSNRELQILKLMASGLTPTAIADQLHISVKTVSSYRARVLEKLSLNTTADLIRYAIENKLS